VDVNLQPGDLTVGGWTTEQSALLSLGDGVQAREDLPPDWVASPSLPGGGTTSIVGSSYGYYSLASVVRVFPDNRTATTQAPTVKTTGSICNSGAAFACWYEARDAEAANPPPVPVQWSIWYRSGRGWPGLTDVRVDAFKHNVRVVVQINYECLAAGGASGCSQYYASGLRDTATVAGQLADLVLSRVP
jgi:hypothetical protein